MQNIHLDPHSPLHYAPHFVGEAQAIDYFEQLLQEIDWRAEKIKLFGKEYWQPRLLAWYGDPDSSYRYSGTEHRPLAWTTTLLELKAKVEAASGSTFNSVLLNQYRHGQDSMGWHSDDEPELGPEPVIASLSLGAARRFRFRPRKGFTGQKREFPLNNGSLLIMHGQTQARWQHHIPKTKKEVGIRINLTFRTIYK